MNHLCLIPGRRSNRLPILQPMQSYHAIPQKQTEPYAGGRNQPAPLCASVHTGVIIVSSHPILCQGQAGWAVILTLRVHARFFFARLPRSVSACTRTAFFFFILYNSFSGKKGTSSSEAGSLLPRTPSSFQHCRLAAVFCIRAFFFLILCGVLLRVHAGLLFCGFPAGWLCAARGFLFLILCNLFSGEKETPECKQ